MKVWDCWWLNLIAGLLECVDVLKEHCEGRGPVALQLENVVDEAVTK